MSLFKKDLLKGGVSNWWKVKTNEWTASIAILGKGKT